MNKIYRSVALAVLASFTLGVAANADGCQPEKRKHVSYRKISKRAASSTKTELIKETKVTTTKTIEKPVVINAPAAPAATVTEEKTVTQPAVVETETPVVIDRYVKRHRSLIHLGLFPFNLFGQ